MTPTTPTTLTPGASGASTSTAQRRKRDRRPLAVVLFSVIAAGLVVAGGTFLQTQRVDRDAASLDEVVLDPRTYATQASANVSRLAELPPVPVDALQPLSATQEAAVADLRQAIEDAMAALDATLAQSALPAVPDEPLSGNVDGLLPPAQPFPLPALPSTDLGLGGLRLQALNVAESPVGSRAGSPLDDALAQVEGLQAQLEDLLGGSPLGELPLEVPPGIGPLSSPVGGTPTQANDARDAVEPDEDGARSAGAHAQSALGGASSLYTATQSDLEQLLDLYEDLVAKVEEVREALEDAQEDGVRALQVVLDERLVSIEGQVASLKAEADRLVARHAQNVAAAGETLAGTVDEARSTQVAAIEATGADVQRQLAEQAAMLKAEAQSRRDDIAAIVSTASTELGEGPEAEQALQAIQAAAAVAQLKVDRELTSRLATIQAQGRTAQEMVDDAKSDLDAMALQAVSLANVTLSEAVVSDLDVQAHLHDVADTYGKLMSAREAKLATQAVADLEDKVAEQMDEVVATALKGTRAPQDALAQVADVVGDAEATLVDEVGKDVEYVAKVGADYGRIPTDERKARAAHWSGLAGSLEDLLQDVVLDGQAVSSLAQDVLAAAEQAEAELEALA